MNFRKRTVREQQAGRHYYLYLKKMLSVLLLICFLQVNAGTNAQRLTLVTKNTPFERVMEDIKTQTGYNFFYVRSHLKDVKPVTFSVTNASLQEVLELLCKEQPVTFEIKDRVIIIKKRNAAEAQVYALPPVTGLVTDEAGNPLAGVSIKIKGTSIGVSTAEDGRFSIDVPENSILEISYVGYITQEIKAGVGSNLNIKLLPGDKNLDEVVIVGFGVQKKVNLTGAVDMITSKQLESRPIANLGSGLQGLIPNLNITTSNGRATTNPNFNIRGFTSINGGDPLIVVDGVPYSMSEVARINPNDVETVSVLKDAAAAAIYGARASFGVVLITTKKAKGNKLNVAFNAMVGSRTIGKLPEFITDPYEVMVIKNEAGKPLYNNYPESDRGYAKQRSEDPSLPAVTISTDGKNRWVYTGTTDWLSEAYNKSAPTYNANLSISKRAEKLSYYFSGDYYQQDGLLKYGNDVYKRYNMRGKVDFDVTDWLTFSNNTQLTSTDYEAPVFLDGDFFWNVNRTNSLDVPRNPDGTWTRAAAQVLGALQEGGRRRDKLNEYITTFSAKAGLVKDVWDLSADVTFRRGSGGVRSYDVPVAYKIGPNDPLEYTFANTWARNENTTTTYNVFNIYTDFHKNFGDHYLQALVGFNQEYYNSNYFWNRRDGLISTSLPSPGTATGNITGSESISDWAVRGVFSRLAYNFREKYLLELNSRYDGSSRFPDGSRWGFFPSASAGWVLSQESFFEPVKEAIALNLFKIRASYGTLGNQSSVGNYAYIPTMSNGQVGYILGTTRPQAVYAPGSVSDNFGWENIATVNFGVDLAFLNNRLAVNFDKYTRYTNDMLIPGKQLPAVFGASVPTENAGDLKTKGWELRLNWRDNGALAGSPFWYNLAFTLADNRTWITRYDNPTKSLGNNWDRYYVGREIGEIWGADIIGVFKDEADIANSPNQTAMGTDDQSYKFYPGDPKFADLNNDGKVDMGKKTVDDPGDMHIIGNSSSRFPYSADLSAGWKGVDLRIFLQGIGKRDWYPGASNIYFWGVFAQPWTNPTVQNADYWTPDNPDAYFPAVRAYSAEDSYQQLGIPNKRYLQNGAYMRIKNVTVGYTLPQPVLQKLRLSKLRFYFSAENIFEISHIKVKLDPESLGGGNRPQASYPFQRTYTFGLNLNL
ncbi:SusC/RagA family TonB-linked outer membrane protein [Niabella aquatica]